MENMTLERPETRFDLDAHFEAYQKDGFTLFKNVWDADTVDEMNATYDRLHAEALREGLEGMSNWWFGSMLERAPELMWRMTHAEPIMEFAEKVMGPLVQLDNLTLSGFESVEPDQFMKVNMWHRDRWAKMPQGIYERPMAVNAIGYGQDMTEDYGPLRVIPGSHMEPLSLTPEELQTPHPREQLVFAEKGDVIFTHNLLLHAGTKNVTGNTRYFFSLFLNSTWMKPTDNLNGPNCQRLIRQATEQRDRRALRFLGVDPTLRSRNNCRFVRPDEELFADWLAEDAAFAQGDEA